MRFSTGLPFLFILSVSLVPAQAHAFGRFFHHNNPKPLPPAPTPTLICNTVPDGYFAGCFFNDTTLSDLKVTKSVANIDFNWGTGSPDPSINPETFSARFTGRFDFDADTYVFQATSDDGARLYIDDQLAIDQWNDHSPTMFTHQRALSAGKHKIELEYYQNLGGSQVKLVWQKASSTGGPPSGQELDLHQASLVRLASDFANWPITTHIKSVTLHLNGVHVEMDNGRPDSWPDTPDRPGMGPLLYSMGIAEKINGTWYASAPVQLWRGLNQSGGGIQVQNVGDGTGRGQIAANWFYDPYRWGTMGGYQPKQGETIGLFICAGDCRDGVGAYSPVHERSNVVLFSLPAPNDEPTLTFP